MSQNRQFYFTLLPSAALLLASAMTACSTTPSSAVRTEHHYLFNKPATSAGVAPVVAEALPSTKGPGDVLHIVYFDFDSYTVRPSDTPILEAHARWLRSHPDRSLMLQGHTDVRGSTEYNLALGQKRAESVRKSLQTLGADIRRVDAVSYGKERPADLEGSAAAYQRNRRVEFEYR